MVMGPLLYKNFRTLTRDLLYKDYEAESKVTLSTISTNGVALKSSASKRGELYVAAVNTEFKWKTVTFGIEVDSRSHFTTSTVIDEIAPGLKAILTTKAPAQPGKVELEYLNQNVGVCASFGLTAKPILNFSAVMGNEKISVGADVSYNTKYQNFIRYGAGVRYSKDDLTTSLIVMDGDTVNATYYQKVNPLTNTVVGAELTHVVSCEDATLLTFGIEHALDKMTNIKARVNNIGKLSGLLQHRLGSKSLVTISYEVNYMNIEKISRFGLLLALKQ